MPFESKSQQRFMFAKHPEMAKEWADKTPDISALPEHVKNMANGGTTAGNPSDLDAGVQDATASDFLLPYLLAPSGMAEGAGARLADEAGAIFPKQSLFSGSDIVVRPGAEKIAEGASEQLAPKMEEAAEAASPKVEAFIKGVQKSPNGNEVKIWGVRGDPDEISKLGYGSDPASVPEHILRAKGVLPTAIDASAQNAPNGYAEGGSVQRSSLAHPTPNGMMARPMADGGYPHVTFMEDQTPEGVKETTHLAKSHEEPKMAEGGTIHKAEDRNKEPAKPKDVDMSHEKKLNSIYKAMGIKKYADGGEVDASQLPPTRSGVPNQSDPSYWDQIKAALGQVTAPISAAIAPAQAINSSVAPAIAPAAAGALNSLTGTSLPVPAAPSISPVNTQAPAAPPIPPVSSPMPPMGGGAPAPVSASTAGMPNIGTIFNQDTSKLTQGVNPEDRQALVTKLQGQQEGLGAVIAQAVNGLGDALAAKGGKEQHSLQNIFAMDKTQRDEAMANFDTARQDRIQKLQLQTQMGDNALKQAAAADAYGTDEHLNQMIGAPKGTMKKDLPTYFQIMSSQVAQQEKNADLYMKAHAQAGTDVDNAVKNSSVLGIKPSPAQLQASGAKLADQYYNRAKGNILVKPSDGGQAQWIPAQNLSKARQMDPNLTVQP